jgi:thiol:disulfide interchange protein
MKRLAILGLVLVLLVSACQEDKTPKNDTRATGDNTPKGRVENPFHELSYDQALEKAEKEKRVVMLDFYGDHCRYCKLLEEETFPDPEVSRFLAERTVAVRIDANKNMDLVKRFAVPGLPCLVFISRNGQVVGRIDGFKRPDEFLREARALETRALVR